MLPAAGDEDDLLRSAEALRSAIGADVIAGLHVTASAGAARTGDGIASSTELIDAADRALYAAKRRGRDQTRLASRLTPQDLIPEEPEAVRVAQGLALAASVREGVAEIGASRVADLASEVARRLGLPEHVQLHCRLGGLLRDVGKVALPDRVLFERGALDDRGVGRDAHPQRDRRAHRAAEPAAPRRRAGRAPSPRALGRHGLSGRPGGRGDPDRGPRRRRLRRVRSDDQRPALAPRRSSTRTRSRSCAASRARSSTRRSPRPSATPSTTGGARRPCAAPRSPAPTRARRTRRSRPRSPGTRRGRPPGARRPSRAPATGA